MAHGCECALDRVGQAQMLPVLRGEVVEGEQRRPILSQAGDSLVVLGTVDFRKKTAMTGH